MYTFTSGASRSAPRVGEGNMRQAIRDAWGRLGLHAPLGQVVAELARLGLRGSPALVARVRIEIMKEAGGRRGRETRAPGGPRTGAWRPQKRPPRRGGA